MVGERRIRWVGFRRRRLVLSGQRASLKPPYYSSKTAGSQTVKHAPPSGRLAACTWPCMASARRRTMYSPRPCPYTVCALRLNRAVDPVKDQRQGLVSRCQGRCHHLDATRAPPPLGTDNDLALRGVFERVIDRWKRTLPSGFSSADQGGRSSGLQLPVNTFGAGVRKGFAGDSHRGCQSKPAGRIKRQPPGI